MKKLYLSFFLIIAFTFYVVLSRGSGSNTYINPPAVVGNNSPAAIGDENSVSKATTAPKSNPTAATKTVPVPVAAQGTFKDGEYAGKVADAYYGNIQVKAIVSGGKLTDVQFLDYPSDRSTSLRISNESMPILKQEAIQAQSAKVNIVSGATQTSNAFVESLDSALAQARI
jgi:uncharacterized protein with FMN-binding domain